MILPLHILIALSTLVLSIVTFFYPSAARLKATYLMTGLTVVSGSLLIIVLHDSILHTCITGLSYVAIISVVTVFARRKLAVALNNKEI